MLALVEYLPSVSRDLRFVFSVVSDVDRHDDGSKKTEAEEDGGANPEVLHFHKGHFYFINNYYKFLT